MAATKPAQKPATTTAVGPRVNYDIPISAAGGLPVLRNTLVKYGPEIAGAIPSTVPLDAKRLIRIALNTFQTTPALMDCTLRSIVYSILQASALGLECDGTLGHAYLVPYKNRCQLIVGYRGYIVLAERSGRVSHVTPHVVLARDEWQYWETDPETQAPKILHRPVRPGSRKGQDDAAGTADDPIVMTASAEEIVAFYSLVFYKDSLRPKVDWMWKEDVDKIRSRSAASSKGPWVTDYIPMGKKTSIRRNLKTAALSPEITRLAVAEESVEFGIADMPLVDYEMPAEIAEAGTKARQQELREQYTQGSQPKKEQLNLEPEQSDGEPPEPGSDG